MTGLEKIIDEIQKSALSSAESIISGAKAEAEAITAKAGEQSGKLCEEIISRAEKSAQAILSRSESGIELARRKEQLTLKQSIIRDTLNAAKDKIISLEDSAYWEFFARIAGKISAGEGSEVVLNAKDRARVPDTFLNAFSGGAVKLSDNSADISGGFLLKYGDVTVNCCVDAIFENYGDALADIAGKVLFA